MKASKFDSLLPLSQRKMFRELFKKTIMKVAIKNMLHDCRGSHVYKCPTCHSLPKWAEMLAEFENSIERDEK